MKSKPNIWFLAGTAAAAVLMAGAAVLLVSSSGRVQEVKRELEQRQTDLAALYRADPFPSVENVRRENENAAKLTQWYGTLVAGASQGQMNVDERKPTAFMTKVGDVREELLAEQGSNIVSGAEVTGVGEFAFGFDRYFRADSKLPPPEHVPRLMEQLLIVERLSRVLFASGVSKLRAVRRELLEGVEAGASPRGLLVNPDAGLMKEGALFTKYHVRLEIEATEAALLGVLNRLARHELFAAVTHVECKKQADDVLPAESVERAATAAPAAADRLPTEAISREQRLMCGLTLENPMQVTLDVDVYRFRTGETP